MRHPFDAVPIAIRIFVAAFFGCACGVTYFLSRGFTTLPSASPPEDGFGSHVANLVLAVASFSVVGFLLMLPVVGVALAAGIALRDWIARNPGAWCGVAVLATWTVGSATLTFGGTPNEWESRLSLTGRFWHGLLSSDGQLILSAAVGAGAAFYLMSMVSMRRRAPKG